MTEDPVSVLTKRYRKSILRVQQVAFRGGQNTYQNEVPMEGQEAWVLILALPLTSRNLGQVTAHSDHPFLIVQRGSWLP